ncbi:hypothetical protein A6A04_00500 [Paramagnetospirillum marisnigri]|uniref:NYN domain-containing protein n=1 Tax=Paramagnetospirillum marisnigri TaxID=1285242 RepID=A0A178MRX4_9PROT|nr:hypothetical protein [Paramagnetospirillum marisnigri]OAN52215.1 hypothetical protein A6A04_00500 [Paramagnetospirillum marisnigri]
MTSVVLIDCENLSSPAQRQTVRRWRDFGRIELFGRDLLVEPWRRALVKAGLTANAEVLVPDDAPPQAADQIMAARIRQLTERAPRPGFIVIASNDKGFDADIALARAEGVAAERQGDPSHPQLLRLVAEELASDGWAPVAGVGDHLARRFGLRLGGRVEALARAAGMELARRPGGLWLRV